MEPGTSQRARIPITILVTLLIVLGEFGFLQAVYHMDDHVDIQRAAQARVAGALETWQPGDDTGPVEEAVRGLGTLDISGAEEVQRLAGAWASSLDPLDLRRLQKANSSLGRAVSAEQDAVDRRAAITLASLLVLVSAGWAIWFRKLVRRHRELQRTVTEKQVVDAGERRLLALVQNSADLVAVLEADSTASFVSPAASSVLGLAPEELIGKRFVDQLLPRDVPMFIRMLAAPREGDQPVILRTRHADGRDLVLEGTLTNLMADAAVQGWVLTVRDVTDRQALQNELSYQAFHDALTGLANRQLFGDRLTHALRRRDGAAGRAVPRPRRLQARQRQPRARDRRPPAGDGGPTHQRGDPGGRHRRPARRRRVRSPDGGRRRADRPRGRGPAPRGTGGARRRRRAPALGPRQHRDGGGDAG